MPTLYIVATPIGNLGDITLRALWVLKEADLILCEDTRVTRKLLDKYDIKTPVESFHAHSSQKKIAQIIKLLEAGKNLALVTDAGTPAISDPGARLIEEVQKRAKTKVGLLESPRSDLEIGIVPVPGASALTAALSVSGLPADEFVFLGFLPHKKGRQTKLKEIAESKITAVLYESPHRILKLLGELAEKLGPERKVVVTRELTKIYEEIKTGSADELLQYYKNNPDKVRGEFVILVSRK